MRKLRVACTRHAARRAASLCVLALGTLGATGCGAPESTEPGHGHGHPDDGDPSLAVGAPPGRPYDGPLYLTPAQATHPQAGAAGDVVDCGTWGAGGFSTADVYAEGATARTPQQALAVARGEGGFSGAYDGLRVAAQTDERVLYVLEVAGVRKQAVVVRDGPATEGTGGPGWYVESWARCDFSELPRSVTDGMGLQIWKDASGRPAATTTIASWAGPSHCAWQSMTFLTLPDQVYVRDPLPDLDDFFQEPFRRHAVVPSDAVATGFHRDGGRLWLSRDRRRAYVGSARDAEVWPRTARPLGCD